MRRPAVARADKDSDTAANVSTVHDAYVAISQIIEVGLFSFPLLIQYLARTLDILRVTH